MEMGLFIVSIVEVLGFRQMNCIIEYNLSGFGDSLGTLSQLIVQITGNRLATESCNSISRNTMGSDSHDPIIQSELFALLEHLFNLCLLRVIIL